jgi:hypothetical protein
MYIRMKIENIRLQPLKTLSIFNKIIFLNLLSIWEVIENSLKSICIMAKKFDRKYKYKYAQIFLR